MRLEYFQMIDKVVAFNAAERSLIARSQVPENSPVFEGHFPGYPLLPGVLLIETMAQACGFLIMALNDFAQLPLLVSVDEAKLRRPVEPCSELTVEAFVEHAGSGFSVMNARILNAASEACSGVLKMRTLPFPNDELRRHILSSAEEAGLLALEG